MKFEKLSKKEMLDRIEALPDKARKELLQAASTRFLKATRLEKILFEKPLFKIPLFFGIFFIISILSSLLPSRVTLVVGSVMSILISTYLVFFIIFIIRKSFKSMFSAQNMIGIFVSYILFILSITVIFALGYSAIDDLGRGYLTYGTCSDDFNEGDILTNPNRSTEYFYFSSVTFFTIGYGDICPMGWAKYLAIFNGFIGNFVTVVVMVVVISSFIKRAQNNT